MDDLGSKEGPSKPRPHRSFAQRVGRVAAISALAAGGLASGAAAVDYGHHIQANYEQAVRDRASAADADQKRLEQERQAAEDRKIGAYFPMSKYSPESLRLTKVEIQRMQAGGLDSAQLAVGSRNLASMTQTASAFGLDEYDARILLTVFHDPIDPKAIKDGQNWIKNSQRLSDKFKAENKALNPQSDAGRQALLAAYWADLMNQFHNDRGLAFMALVIGRGDVGKALNKYPSEARDKMNFQQLAQFDFVNKAEEIETRFKLAIALALGYQQAAD